jgi:hypothetical protein
MRLFAVLVPLVVAGALAAAPGLARPGAGAAMVDCGAKQMSVLFWPQGHQVVPSVKFSAYPLPHTEIYETDPTFAGASFLAFFNSSAQTVPSPRIPFAQTTSATTALNCSFPRPTQFEIVAQPGGTSAKIKGKIRTRLVTKTTLTTVLAYQMGSDSSTLTYDSKLCVAAPAPS